MDAMVTRRALGDFVAETATGPIRWGVDDCALWCASAVDRVTGFDPAADLRGTYCTWIECRNLLHRAGGLLELVRPRMVHPALCRLDRDGVAVVRADGVTLCALVVDGRAVARTSGGVRVFDGFEILGGWGCRRR